MVRYWIDKKGNDGEIRWIAENILESCVRGKEQKDGKEEETEACIYTHPETAPRAW